MGEGITDWWAGSQATADQTVPTLYFAQHFFAAKCGSRRHGFRISLRWVEGCKVRPSTLKAKMKIGFTPDPNRKQPS